MSEKLTIFLFSFFSAWICANTTNDTDIIDGRSAVKESITTSYSKKETNKLFLPTSKIPELPKYNLKKDPIDLGEEVHKQPTASQKNIEVLPDLFNSSLSPSFYVQGRFLEKENMSRESSDIEGAAVNFIFVN